MERDPGIDILRLRERSRYERTRRNRVYYHLLGYTVLANDGGERTSPKTGWLDEVWANARERYAARHQKS